MIQLIHKYWKSLCGVLVLAALCLVMADFGVGSFDQRRDSSYAVKIDNLEISHNEYYRQRRNLEDRYRQMFGESYHEIAESMLGDLGQQVVDKLIADYLIERYAKSMNLHVSENEVASILQTELFPNGFDRAQYAAFLRNVGLSAAQFEDQLRSEALRSKLVWLLTDLSLPSDKEIKAQIKREKSKYDVQYVTLNPESLLSEVPEPSAEVLEAFYDREATEYERPARVSYDFVVFEPSQFKDRVAIFPEDVEVYYADRQRDFMLPETVKARHIQISYPSDSDPQKMLAVEEKAREVHAMALEGADFGDLVLAHSDDVATQILGGELGELRPGQMGRDFDRKVFAMQGPGVADLVSTDYGYHIVMIDEFTPARPRPLEEVKGEIEDLFRKREAPAYAAFAARELFESWGRDGEELSTLVEGEDLTVQSTGLLKQTEDLDPQFRGLTHRIFSASGQSRQLVELGDRSIIVSVRQFQEAEIPALEEIKAELTLAYKKTRARQLAREKLEQFITEAQAEQSFTSAAADLDLVVKQEKGLTSTQTASGIFAQQNVREALFSSFSSERMIQDVFEMNNNLYVLKVDQVEVPASDALQTDIVSQRDQQASAMAQTMLTSILNRLKAEADIDIDPYLLVSR